MNDTIRDLDREIDDPGIRDEVEREAAEFARLMQPVLVPGLGIVSALAARMLADTSPYWFQRRDGHPVGHCYMLGASAVHIKPDCRCPRRRR